MLRQKRLLFVDTYMCNIYKYICIYDGGSPLIWYMRSSVSIYTTPPVHSQNRYHTTISLRIYAASIYALKYIPYKCTVRTYLYTLPMCKHIFSLSWFVLIKLCCVQVLQPEIHIYIFSSAQIASKGLLFSSAPKVYMFYNMQRIT